MAQWNHFSPTGLFRIAFSQEQFAALEIQPGLIEQKHDLERKYMIAVQVLVEAAVVILPITQ
ncbi:hypothetical protein D3C86_2208470 [compost metagenome]